MINALIILTVVLALVVAYALDWWEIHRKVNVPKEELEKNMHDGHCVVHMKDNGEFVRVPSEELAKFRNDGIAYGSAVMRIDSQGRLEHIPIEELWKVTQ